MIDIGDLKRFAFWIFLGVVTVSVVILNVV
jgi:hypothetical protein